MTSQSRFPVLLLAAIAIVLAISTAIRAQQDPPKPTAADTQKELEQRQELEKKTLALLNEIASAAWGLKLQENRFFVMTNAADLL